MSRSARFHPALLVVLGGAALAACSSPSAPSCPSDLPASCPTPTPSYKTDVVPIIQGYCYPCHGPGGIEQAAFDYTTYQGVYASRSAILDQVYSCVMPPTAGESIPGVDGGSPSLTLDARVKLLGWLVCEAPDN